MTYAREAISREFQDFEIDYSTICDVENTIDFVKSQELLRNGLDDNNIQMWLNIMNQNRGNYNAVREDSHERNVEYQIVRNYFLLRAVMTNSIWEVVESLKRGAEVNEYSLYKGARSFPIIEAARLGSTRIASELIEAGADVNIAKTNGESAIGMAADSDNMEMARLLLSNGADPNQVAHEGFTPLTQAETPDMIELLLKHGADPNIPDSEGDLPIVTRISNRDLASTLVLYRGGTDMDRRNLIGVSAREYFARFFGYNIEDRFGNE